jgi:hypothetical protein
MGRIATALLALIVLSACTRGGDSDDAADSAAATAPGTAPAATDAMAAADTIAGTGEDDVGSGDIGAPADEQGAGRVASLLQLAGPSIAIEARATVRADDVRAAVDSVTGTVTRRGGRVASADIDYAPEDGGAEQSRATLVLAVPRSSRAFTTAANSSGGVVAAPPAVFGLVAREFEPPLPGVAEAVADGWGAFVSGAYAVVLVLATVVPFLVVAALLALAVFWVRRTVAA